MVPRGGTTFQQLKFTSSWIPMQLDAALGSAGVMDIWLAQYTEIRESMSQAT
jgi:hypothetical protein